MKSSEEKRQLYWLVKRMTLREAWQYALAEKDSDIWTAICQCLAGIILLEHAENKSVLRLMWVTAFRHSLKQYPGDRS